jgi:hypothetical protein
MTITQKTRGNKKPTRDTQRVFFCCDRRNIADREGLIADLLSEDAGMDCLVSYLETPDDVDIRSYDDLLEDDKGTDVREYDRNIVCAMPFMMMENERIKRAKEAREK